MINGTTPTTELASTAYQCYYTDEIDALMEWARDDAAQYPLEPGETVWDQLQGCIESDIRDLLKNGNLESLFPDAAELNDLGQEELADRFLSNYDAMQALARGITNHIREDNPGLTL